MTVETIEPATVEEAFAKLSDLAHKHPCPQFVFRGQQDSEWKLCTSYERYWPREVVHDGGILDDMIQRFRSGVARLDLNPEIKGDLSWLEYARHHGCPAPLLDFSWSPFVALYFAFDGIRVKDDTSRAAVYCLNLHQLAREVAREKLGEISPLEDPDGFREHYRLFLKEGDRRFDNCFPMNEVIFIRNPSPHTRRMHAQLGVFLYYTKNFEGDNSPASFSLDRFLDGIEEGFDGPLSQDKRPVMTKVVMPHAMAPDVFSRLDVMNINGMTMLMSAEGVGRDVYNSYNYQARAAYLRP